MCERQSRQLGGDRCHLQAGVCEELTVKSAVFWFMTTCSLSGGTDFWKERCDSVFREQVRTEVAVVLETEVVMAVVLEPGEPQSKL